MDRLSQKKSLYYPLWILLLCLYIPLSTAETSVENKSDAQVAVESAVTENPSASLNPQQAQPLEKRIQNLKREVSRLNRDLFILEEELLYPASTQIVVFISLENGNLFQLDAVELKINDKRVASHLYTEREVNSLKQGGVQRLYIGNLPTGEHELVAFFTGKGPNGVDYRRGSTLRFEKELSTKYIELKISDNARTQQPEFLTKQW